MFSVFICKIKVMIMKISQIIPTYKVFLEKKKYNNYYLTIGLQDLERHTSKITKGLFIYHYTKRVKTSQIELFKITAKPCLTLSSP